MARVSTTKDDNIYYNRGDESDDYYYTDDARTGTNFPLTGFIFTVLLASLMCTIAALLCDITVLIAHFISSKVMNSVSFRALVGL